MFRIVILEDMMHLCQEAGVLFIEDDCFTVNVRHRSRPKLVNVGSMIEVAFSMFRFGFCVMVFVRFLVIYCCYFRFLLLWLM